MPTRKQILIVMVIIILLAAILNWDAINCTRLMYMDPASYETLCAAKG